MSYDDIRPYHDDEVNHYIHELLKDEVFGKVLMFIFQTEPKVREIRQTLADIQTVDELQTKFMYPLINSWIISRTTNGVTCSGLDALDRTQSYLFISNHRDIILDAALMNYIIFNAGMKTTEIAIGNNLLIYNWIEYAVKLNRAFVVKRNLPAKELFAASQQLSAYIRESITRNNDSVWIAQREGRTKDGNDQTQSALIKMLNLSNTKSLIEGFRDLKIVPLAISYEREPCGISKVEEIYKRTYETYVKKPQDDLKSMAFGLIKPKGRVHFAFGAPVDAQLDDIIRTDNVNEAVVQLSEYIDSCIYLNYQLRPYNYLATDMLRGENKYAAMIDAPVREKFNEMLDDLVATINSGDAAIQRDLFLKMYAAPLLNKEKLPAE